MNIFDNLHGKIKKPQCQRALDALTDAGEIQMKEYGKSKIYLLNQKNIPEIDEKQMDALNKKLGEVKAKYNSENEEYKEMTTLLKELQIQPTNEELDKEIEKYTKLVLFAFKYIRLYF